MKEGIDHRVRVRLLAWTATQVFLQQIWEGKLRFDQKEYCGVFFGDDFLLAIPPEKEMIFPVRSRSIILKNDPAKLYLMREGRSGMVHGGNFPNLIRVPEDSFFGIAAGYDQRTREVHSTAIVLGARMLKGRH
jgi:hypothetical protein